MTNLFHVNWYVNYTVVSGTGESKQCQLGPFHSKLVDAEYHDIRGYDQVVDVYTTTTYDPKRFNPTETKK